MISPEQLKALEDQHKRIAHVTGDGWECVFRKPTSAEYKRLRADLHHEETKPNALEYFARRTVIVPDAVAFDALLEEYPAIPEACGKALQALAGLTGGANAK